MTDLSFAHRFIPAADHGPSAVLLLLHGTGGDENDLIPLGRTLLPGAALLSPRGKVLENGMPRYFRRFAEGVFDIADLQFRAHELAAFVEAARREYRLTGDLVAVGYSNGANIAAGLLLLKPGLLAGAVLFRPMTPFVPDQPPDLNGTRVLLAAGNRDPIVPSSQTEQLAQILNGAGAIVSFHWHPGGHELGQDDIDAAQRWLAAGKS